MNTAERFEWIHKATLYQLLEKWRFEPVGSPWFEGEVGTVFSARLTELRNRSPEQWTAVSKQLGWS